MRFRVLYSLDQPGQSIACGVAIDEAQHGTRLVLPWECGLPERLTEPYNLIGPNLEEITYVPGDPAYFDQCMYELGQVFAVGGDHDTEQPSCIPTETSEP